MNIIYGPAPGRVTATVEDTVIHGTLAVTQLELEADDANAETLEMLPARVTFRVPGCIEEQQLLEDGVVTIEQGRTTVLGSGFLLPAGSDIGTLQGPIQLERAAMGDDTPITATADRLTFLVTDQETTLSGAVTVTSAERTTTADELFLDEEAGTATLTGNPARSVKGNDVVEGQVLLYYLDNDDIVVIGGVQAQLELD